MEPDDHTDLRFTLNDRGDPEDVIDLLFLRAFAAGPYRHARAASLSRIRHGATLLPPGVRPGYVASNGRHRVVLARGEGWMVRARRWPDASGDVAVVARSHALAERILADAVRGACEPPSIDPHRVSVGFWHRTDRRASRAVRTVDVAPWGEIRRNYTAATARAGDRLMAQDPGAVDGRLILLHGPPGTGKTTMLRALAVAWRRWCRLDCVLDPERLFSQPSYLL